MSAVAAVPLRRLGMFVVATAAALILVVALASPAAAEHVEVDRAAGDNRYGTAAALAERSFPDGVDTAFLVTGATFPDAATANYPAGASGAPVLLTARDTLPQATSAALENLGVQDVIVLGGTGAVSEGVERELAGAGYDTERIAASNRYATAAAVADTFAEREGVGLYGGLRTAVVVSGERFADGLTAGPLAAYGDHPVLLTQQHRTNAPMMEFFEAHDIEQVIIVGGTAAVSEDVEAEFGETMEVIRFSGQTRFDTAVAVGNFLVFERTFGGDNWILTRGDHFIDGMVAGAHGGEVTAPLIFSADPGTPAAPIQDWLRQLCHEIEPELVRAVGGTAALHDETVVAVVDAVGSCHH